MKYMGKWCIFNKRRSDSVSPLIFVLLPTGVQQLICFLKMSNGMTACWWNGLSRTINMTEAALELQRKTTDWTTNLFTPCSPPEPKCKERNANKLNTGHLYSVKNNSSQSSDCDMQTDCMHSSMWSTGARSILPLPLSSYVVSKLHQFVVQVHRLEYRTRTLQHNSNN